jgi:ribosomal protein L7/L12
MADPKNIPPEVAALLKKGDKVGAMKLLLQQSNSGGGIIGKTVIAALENAAKSGQVQVKVTGNLPPDVLAALANGNKIEAIKLLRERTGLGLAEAKNHVEAYAHSVAEPEASPLDDGGDHMVVRKPGAAPQPRPKPQAYVKRDGLSPGEVAKTSGGLQAVIFVVAIAAAAWLYYAFG